MAPLMELDGLVRTIGDDEAISDGEVEVVAPTSHSSTTKRKRDGDKQSSVKKPKIHEDFNPDFEFSLEDDIAQLQDYHEFGQDAVSGRQQFDLEASVARRGYNVQEREGNDMDVQHQESFDGDSDSETSNHKASTPSDDESEPDEERNSFYAKETKNAISTSHNTFMAMKLTRPTLRGLAEVGFSTPTPIQSKTIPVALAGKDVVGGAVTGSGKTAAFIIPILERLMWRDKRMRSTRVVILMPTRELALQCLNVARKLASHTDITFGEAIGGLNLREQEKQMKQSPDIVIATPGRFIDLERNTNSLKVNTIEVLVLDEADRMLEEGFADELNEILSKIPKSRQTMVFSATMTSKVDDLIRAGLRNPVRLVVDAQKSTVSGLVQEFVRVRPARESKRLGYLMHICTKVHTDRAIVFFRQKKEAHRSRILFALCGLKAAELHGDMTQQQRIQAIEDFRSGKAAFLLSTDVASRGLDIKGIECVINYEAPQSHEIYLHRVGRTARAGRSGRSCTISADSDRKVVKAAVKGAKKQGAAIRSRMVRKGISP